MQAVFSFIDNWRSKITYGGVESFLDIIYDNAAFPQMKCEIAV